MRSFLVITSLVLVSDLALAQGGSAASRQTPDSVFSRAVALNNEQRGAEARALVDSMLRVTQPGNAVYGDALFWKGVLAESEQVAEESYKQIVLDYPLHRRAEEALIRLAQLEIMRGNRVQAQRYLDRIVVEHPFGQYRAKASYWRARLFFEENEIDRACAELGTARARLPDGDVELKAEIDFAAQRCASVPVPSGPPAQRSGGAAPPPPDRSTGGDTTSGNTAGGSAARGSAARGGAQSAAARGAAQTPPGRGARQSDAASRGTSGAASGVTTGRGTTDSSARGGTKAAPAKVMYSVQAAAFPPKDKAKENAEAFIQALKDRGYEARLVGSSAPYRVWIGLFATRAEAAALAAELKSKRISSDAFVVEAERK